MNGLLEKSSPSLSARRIHGRAVNAVADLLRAQLSVPEIYLEPKIAGSLRPDILAVDRAGSGDLHIVEIKVIFIFPTRTQFRDLVARLKTMPFHFKYLALPGFSADLSDSRRFSNLPELFDETGIGRVGIISFDRNILQASSIIDKSSVALTLRPERFRVSAPKLEAVEKYLSKAKPDISVRL